MLSASPGELRQSLRVSNSQLRHHLAFLLRLSRYKNPDFNDSISGSIYGIVRFRDELSLRSFGLWVMDIPLKLAALQYVHTTSPDIPIVETSTKTRRQGCLLE